MKTLETKRLLLRDWQENDVLDMFEFYKSPNVWPKAGGKIQDSIEDCLKCIHSYNKCQEVWAIALKKIINQ